MIGLIDTGELVIMLLLAALVIFILWESFKRAKPASRNTSATPGQTASELGLLIGAVVLATTGTLTLWEPTHGHTTGRSAFFWNAVFGAFGQAGIAAVFWTAAVLALGVWYVRRKTRLSSAQKQAHSGR